MPEGRPVESKFHMIVLTEKMHAAYRHSDRRTHCRCQRRTVHPQAHGKHKHIVKHNIEQTARYGTQHGSCRCMVVARESRKCVIRHEKRRGYQNDTQIILTQCRQRRIGAQKLQQLFRQKNTDKDKWNAAQHTAQNGLCKIKIYRFPLLLADTVPGSRADADHGANGIHQTEYRQNQI